MDFRTSENHRFGYFWQPESEFIHSTRFRRRRLAAHGGCGVCAIIGARSHCLTLSPLNLMRGHGTFEILFQNACKYASILALQKSRGFIYVEHHFSPTDLIPGFGPSHVCPKPLQLLQLMVNARTSFGGKLTFY